MLVYARLVPYEIPAVCVSRSWMVMARLAGTMRPSASATIVFLKVAMKLPTGSEMPILPSSTSIRIAALVIAFVCAGILLRNIPQIFSGKNSW
jgi:hypothetical protein